MNKTVKRAQRMQYQSIHGTPEEHTFHDDPKAHELAKQNAGLGSGALREALERLRDEALLKRGEADRDNLNLDLQYFEGEYRAYCKALAALSLFSPIEPGRFTVGNVTGVLFNAGISLSAYVATRVASEFNAIIGAPTSQASSEVRGKMMASFDKVIPSVETRVQIVNCILDALSPSRQGAGGK